MRLICRIQSALLSISVFQRQQSYLARLGPLTDVRLIHGGKGGRVVVDVQEADGNRHMAALTRIICKTNRQEELCHPGKEKTTASGGVSGRKLLLSN